MAAVDPNITIKLLVDARSNKVLFAEGGKDFVDFLFSLFTLPLGSVIKLLSPQRMVGSIGRLYQSVENLNETYLVAKKDNLLQPAISSLDGSNPLINPIISSFDGKSPLLLAGPKDKPKLTYYTCNNKHHVTTHMNTTCPSCSVSYHYGHSSGMNTTIHFIDPPPASSNVTGNGGESVRGFVKDVITYMITDDLEVTPVSTISSITLINRFSVKKNVQLEEKTVNVGMKEGLALLEASLGSSTVLTDAFLKSSTKEVKETLSDSS